MGYRIRGYKDRVYIEIDEGENPEYRTLQMAKDAALKNLRRERDKWACAIEEITRTTAAALE